MILLQHGEQLRRGVRMRTIVEGQRDLWLRRIAPVKFGKGEAVDQFRLAWRGGGNQQTAVLILQRRRPDILRRGRGYPVGLE